MILTPSKSAWLSDSIFIAQPKTGVCTTENWGLQNFKKYYFFILHNRKLGFFRHNITKIMLVGINKGSKNVLNYINTSDYRQKTYKK